MSVSLKNKGYVFLVVKIGDDYGYDKSKSITEINGKLYNRHFYIYNKKILDESFEKHDIKFDEELYLEEENKSMGWRYYIYRKI